MTKIPIRNRGDSTLRIMIEPAAQAYDIPSDEEALISGDFDLEGQGIEIEFWGENFLSVWIVSDVSVTLAGKKLVPLKEA